MPTADLRALAGKLGMLKPCEVCGGIGATGCAPEFGNHIGFPCRACGGDALHAGTGDRLPSEAEVRAAILATPAARIQCLEITDCASHVEVRFSGGRTLLAKADEAAPDNLVLLALLRALEACRRGPDR